MKRGGTWPEKGKGFFRRGWGKREGEKGRNRGNEKCGRKRRNRGRVDNKEYKLIFGTWLAWKTKRRILGRN